MTLDEETCRLREARGRDGAAMLVRHLNGDTDAFPELVAAYKAQVYSYLVYAGIDASSRDDIFQEIFFTIHREGKRFDSTRPFEPWMFTVAANIIRSTYRRNRGRRQQLTDELPEVPCPGPSLDEQAEGEETARWLSVAMDDLPREQREAIYLCCIRGLDQQEAASILSIPLGTIKTHVRRGRLQLAKWIAQRNAQISREVRR